MQTQFPYGKYKTTDPTLKTYRTDTLRYNSVYYMLSVLDQFRFPLAARDSWHSSSSCKMIVDEVAPIKKSPPMGLRADSFECDVTRLIRGL